MGSVSFDAVIFAQTPDPRIELRQSSIESKWGHESGCDPIAWPVRKINAMSFASSDSTRIVPRAVGQSSETDLLCRIGAGDRGAFEALFLRFAPKLKAYLMGLGASDGMADDLAQDAMVTVWRRAKTYDPALARPSTWLFVIARNAWIDRLRREKVELVYQMMEPPASCSPDERPDEAAMRASDHARMAALLSTLPDEQRQVVRLSFFEDLPHSDIAEHLSLPLGTVKSRLRLALSKLRSQWEQHA